MFYGLFFSVSYFEPKIQIIFSVDVPFFYSKDKTERKGERDCKPC